MPIGLGISLVVMPVCITCGTETTQHFSFSGCSSVWSVTILTHEKVKDTRVRKFQQSVEVLRVRFADNVTVAVVIVHLPPEMRRVW